MREAAASGAYKPLDLGNGLVCVSFGRDASWLSLGTPHPEQGFVELNALPPFDEAQRGDPDATRRYRALMVRDRYAVLRVEVDGAPLTGLSVDAIDPLRPRWTGRLAGIWLEVEARADASAIHQRWRLESTDGTRALVVLRLRGRLDRPALAEITELDPPLPTGARTQLDPSGPVAHLRASELPAVATIHVFGHHTAWEAVADDELQMRLECPDDGSEVIFEVSGSISSADAAAESPMTSADGSLRWPETAGAGSVHSESIGRLTERALGYVRGCTTLRTGPDERAILTDHRILPLSWTRDAYWQALLLLSSDASDDRERVADHLRWLWRRCERPDGRWARSHHADGRRKDRAFQADQQLYPIVELTDFWRVAGALPDGVDWTDAVAGAWSAALAEVDPRTGLMASAENAADDPAPAPFIGASQILLWYCAARLAELADDRVVALDAGELRRTGHQVHSAFDTHLGATGGWAYATGGWAYATDGAGMRVEYHDANDLPVALAPLWGFCGPGDPGWRATMRFAFSPANPGYVDGDRPGLGSAHTPGPWTLGDVQAWVAARVIGDDAAADAALVRLHEVAFVDGMLPEAYTATGTVDLIRHWFAWPGAALAALRILDADARLESRLSARPVR
jgi:uncharacterized protein